MTDLATYTAMLYDHKFDVDDIIRALCGADHTGRWLLNTRTGTLTREETPSPIQDGDDQNHWHVIEPLPTVYLQELNTHTKRTHLTEDEREKLNKIINNSKNIFDIYCNFDETRLGAWLRERVKEAALDWLDSRNMVPPSMRHVHRIQSPHEHGKSVKITIQSNED